MRSKKPKIWSNLLPLIARMFRMGTTVDVALVGVPKSGTTSLHRMLTSSSYFNFSKKEIHFFADDNWYRQVLGEHLFHCHYPLNFNKGGRLNIDTGFSLYHPDFAKRILAYNPNIRIIVCLRNPTSRYISDYIMIRRFYFDGKPGGTDLGLIEKIKFDMKTLNECIKNRRLNPNNILRTGLVAPSVERLISHIPKRQLLFIAQEELKSHHSVVMQRIGAFLNLDLNGISQVKINQAERHSKKLWEPFSKDEHIEAIRLLDDFYRPHNRRLELIIREFKSTGTNNERFP